MFGILAPSVASAQKSKTSSLDQKVTAMLDRAVKNFTKNANLAQRQIDSAFVFVKQKNSLSQSTIAYYHVVKGNEYKNTSKYDLAINSYLESLKIYEQLNDLGQIGIVKVNMASILLDLKQFDKAEAMAKAAIEVHRKNKHYNALSKAQSLLAGIFFNKGNAKEALPIIAEAIESAKNGKDSVQLISLYTNRIQTFFRFKQPEKATPDIEELEALAIKTRDQRGQANAQFYKGYVAKTQGRYKEADSLYEASYVYFDKIRDFYRQRDIFNAMSANALLMKDYEKAVNAKQWAGDILDSIFNEKQQKTINELNIKFDTEKKEKQLLKQQDELELAQLREAKAALEINNSTLELKEKEQELSNAELLNRQTRLESERNEAQIDKQNEEIKAANQRQLFLIIGFSALAIFLGLLARQYFATRKANMALAQSNEKIEMMLRELHHRVKNNLQMVSSLFRLQARKMSDAGTAKVLKEGQARVEAMSILHQQLYQNEAITNINLKTYLQSLVEKLQYAYGFSQNSFSYQLSVEPEEIDVDKALPIGLIVNELLTNSFKYAFDEQSSPSVHLIVRPDYLHYSDNGKGLPESFNPKEVDSFGTRLITSFSQQLKGQYEFWSDKGLNFKLTWKN